MPPAQHQSDGPPDHSDQKVRLVPWQTSTPGAAPEGGIGERLKYSRNELSLSIEALGRLTKSYDTQERKGVSPSSLLRYENGDSLPGARELRLLCDALEVPPQWLLTGEIPGGGTSAVQHQLLRALADFVRETMGDSRQDATRGAVLREIGEVMSRAGRLSDARKPPAD